MWQGTAASPRELSVAPGQHAMRISAQRITNKLNLNLKEDLELQRGT